MKINHDSNGKGGIKRRIRRVHGKCSALPREVMKTFSEGNFGLTLLQSDGQQTTGREG